MLPGKILHIKHGKMSLTQLMSRRLGAVAFDYVTSTELSDNLLPLVQSLNPDFFFGMVAWESRTDFLDWLKACLSQWSVREDANLEPEI